MVISLLAVFCFISFTSCSVVGLVGDAVVLTGKVATAVVKTTGAVIITTGKLAGATIRYFKGKKTIKLEREGNTYYVKVKINNKRTARLILDTGASSVQISSKLSKKLKIKETEGEIVQCRLADGSIIPARSVVLKEVKLDGVHVENVSAIIIDNDNEQDSDGLLGMSFLNNFIFQIDPDNNLLILQYKSKSE